MVILIITGGTTLLKTKNIWLLQPRVRPAAGRAHALLLERRCWRRLRLLAPRTLPPRTASTWSNTPPLAAGGFHSLPPARRRGVLRIAVAAPLAPPPHAVQRAATPLAPPPRAVQRAAARASVQRATTAAPPRGRSGPSVPRVGCSACCDSPYRLHEREREREAEEAGEGAAAEEVVQGEAGGTVGVGEPAGEEGGEGAAGNGRKLREEMRVYF